MRRSITAVILVLMSTILGGCIFGPGTLITFSEERAMVRSYLFSPYEQVHETASSHCEIHNAIARPINQTCADNFCLSSDIIFACDKLPDGVKPSHVAPQVN